ncbi:hypothetical protein HaLaN_29547 [Haematococcus lacustris]|uniref:Uncharacterized protein n=1 Tax=Haematococcus lacustris TaxID=44745 RepID=A0A6A0ADB9_HAELA|nr:hypothetical protein HaLaN_29547 [Haematococcus lacustris]
MHGSREAAKQKVFTNPVMVLCRPAAQGQGEWSSLMLCCVSKYEWVWFGTAQGGFVACMRDRWLTPLEPSAMMWLTPLKPSAVRLLGRPPPLGVLGLSVTHFKARCTWARHEVMQVLIIVL